MYLLAQHRYQHSIDHTIISYIRYIKPPAYYRRFISIYIHPSPSIPHPSHPQFPQVIHTSFHPY